jgi:hypothetical protein
VAASARLNLAYGVVVDHHVSCTAALQLAATVNAVAQHALQYIDLRAHAAQHPRLGVLDHVAIHPLGPQATLSQAAQAAAAIGQQLCQQPLQLPVYYYGAAHPKHRRLAEIRRRLGEVQSLSVSSAQHPRLGALWLWAVTEDAAVGRLPAVPLCGAALGSSSSKRARCNCQHKAA